MDTPKPQPLRSVKGKAPPFLPKVTSTRSHPLLDYLLLYFGAKYDIALSRRLEVCPAMISRVRNRICQPSDGFLIRIHDVTGIDIKTLQYYARLAREPEQD